MFSLVFVIGKESEAESNNAEILRSARWMSEEELEDQR